jgi:hypothetical protein
MNDAVKIKIKTMKNGKRMALYQPEGTHSVCWWSMPVRQAERALREGKVHIGVNETLRVIPA